MLHSCPHMYNVLTSASVIQLHIVDIWRYMVYIDYYIETYVDNIYSPLFLCTTDIEPRTHEQVRLTQQRHDSYLRRGETKAKVKASFKESGIKDSCAFSKLEYFDVVDGYQLDGMHIFSNVVALHHNALLGGGWSENVQLFARAFDRNAHVVCQRPATGPSPWALSK